MGATELKSQLSSVCSGTSDCTKMMERSGSSPEARKLIARSKTAPGSAAAS